MGSNRSAIAAGMLPIEKIATSEIEFRDEVIELSKRAQDFIGSMSWCGRIVNGWLDYACGYVIGVFFFEISPVRPDIPAFHWVVVGDLPPAYLDAECCKTGHEAVEGYVAEMQEWVDRVLQGRPIGDDVIPVNVPPEKNWAEELQSRLDLLRELFLNKCEDTSGPTQ